MTQAYFVNESFTVFQRDYRRGIRLTVDDLACWLPEEAGADTLKELLSSGKLAPEPVEAPAAPVTVEHPVEPLKP